MAIKYKFNKQALDFRAFKFYISKSKSARCK